MVSAMASLVTCQGECDCHGLPVGLAVSLATTGVHKERREEEVHHLSCPAEADGEMDLGVYDEVSCRSRG